MQGNTKAIKIVWNILFWVMYGVTLFLEPSWLANIWQMEVHPLLYESVSGYSMDSHGNFWIVSRKSRGDYRVYHFSGTVDREWKLPGDLLEDQYLRLVSGDEMGSPIVWLNNGVYHYDQKNWVKIPYADALDLGGWDWDERGTVLMEQGWAIREAEQGGSLLKINALTGEWSVLPLPEEAMQEGLLPLSMRQVANGDLLVLMENDNSSRAKVYRLSEDQWQPRAYPIPVSTRIDISDYFLDDRGVFWVLSRTEEQFFIEKIDTAGRPHMTRVPVSDEAGNQRLYRFLCIDSSERLWISDTDVMSVFTPVWDGNAAEIVYYTEENSNYQDSISVFPAMLPDGRVWSFGRLVTSMDTNQADLPVPLPVWFVSWGWTSIGFGIILALILFNHYFIRRNSSQKQKGTA